MGMWPDSLLIDPAWIDGLSVELYHYVAEKPLIPDDPSWLAQSVVIGYLYRHDLDGLHRLFITDSQVESVTPIHRGAGMAAASLVALACTGAAPDTWLRQVYTLVDGQSDTLDLTLLRIGHVLGWTSVDLAMKHIGRGESPDEVVALALYSALCSPSDIMACLSRLREVPAAASLAGAVLGAHLGWAGFPADWRSRCTNVAPLDELAARIAQVQSTLGSRSRS
ncbi:MAG: hypothetical protein JNM70_14555 [Anaerolineae bacterium]|nr:hypothetical protein [Anaerolineae bacterium]